ncbi:hypothetical protein JCM8547_002382 [Rhodosporidiobolus lusitaniae]
MSTFASTSTYSLQAKDAAAKEREDRLRAAKNKLKQYRARTSQRLGSTSSAGTDLSSPARSNRRQSGLTSSISSNADFAAKHAHRRSQSKSGLLAAMGGDSLIGHGAGGPGHARRMSKSRQSRSSISLKKGHGHNRSRASISMSFSGPGALVPPPSAGEQERSTTPTPRAPSLGAPASWMNGNVVTGPSHSPDVSRGSGILRSTSPLPPAPSPGPHPTRHGRQGSRHARQTSVSNFRESLDLVGGHKNAGDPSLLHPAVSSFASTHDGTASPSTAASLSPSVTSGWSNDPHQVLAALKERGRREVDDPSLSPEMTRQSALEALEGRVSAPSEMISLGEEEPGQLLSAPKSPGFTTAASSTSPLPSTPSFSASPMIGLGVSGPGGASKRSSWGQLGGVAQVGAQGVMELGGIAEEDEEEEEEYNRKTGKSPVSSPKRGSPIRNNSVTSPRKGRPSSIIVEPRNIDKVVASSQEMTPQRSYSPANSPSASRRSSIRPLSLSLSSTASSAGTPSTTNGPFGRRDSLAAPSSPDDMRTSSPEQRRISMFHSAAAAGLDPTAVAPSPGSQSALPGRSGFRTLSIGGGHSPSSQAERRLPGRSASVGGAGAHSTAPFNPLSASAPPSSTPRAKPPTTITQKRSSLQYRNSPASTPEAQRRISYGFGRTASPAATTPTYSTFPFGSSGGAPGDLEIDGDFDSSSAQPSPSRSSFGKSTGPTSTRTASTASAAAAAAAAAEEISSLRSQVSSLEARNAQLASTHALEIDEFERKATEEAREMRSRITALEQAVDEERTGRAFEVEALQREAAMTQEAMKDLVDERDALREDVSGWRTRCANLEQVVQKAREDEAIAQAQSKLVSEMRDHILTLVAALEREKEALEQEKNEHEETRAEVERLLEEKVVETAAALNGGRPDDLALIMEEEDEEDEQDQHKQEQDQHLGRHHPYKAASDGSMLSMGSSNFSRSFSGNNTEDTSVMTDEDSYYSNGKLSSPPSGHSSFSGAVNGAFPPPTNANRNSVSNGDAVAIAIGQLDTLAEEDEEDEEALVGGTPATISAPSYAQQQEYVDDRARMSSTSTTSTNSDVMPRTPERPSADHNRSHSFIRHWSFPRGTSTTPRPSMESVDDQIFFGYNKHDSLPALPVDHFKEFKSDEKKPCPNFPFEALLTSQLDVDEDSFNFFPPQLPAADSAQHVRRPSSPRPQQLSKSLPASHSHRVSNSHLRRLSAQNRPPPPSPSALASMALQQQQPATLPHHQAYPSAASSVSSNVSPAKSTSRYSWLFGRGGSASPSFSTSHPAAAASTLPPPPATKLSFSTTSQPLVEEDEDEGFEEDMFITTHGGDDHRSHHPYQAAPPPPAVSHCTPVQLQHQSQQQNRLRYIAKHEVPQPTPGRLSQLDFSRSVCCVDMPVFIV